MKKNYYSIFYYLLANVNINYLSYLFEVKDVLILISIRYNYMQAYHRAAYARLSQSGNECQQIRRRPPYYFLNLEWSIIDTPKK